MELKYQDEIEYGLTCLEFFTEKFYESLNSFLLVFHPFHVPLLRFSRECRRYHIISIKLSLCTYR